MKQRIVISGIGVVSPYGIGTEIFQNNICQGISAIKKLEFLPHVGAKLSPTLVSPLPGPGKALPLRMSLAAAEEAWQIAAIPEKSRVALACSIGWNDQLETQPLVDTENALAKHFNLNGPSISCFSACAASTQSIGNACRILESGQADFCLAGGADSRLHTLGALGYSLLGALAGGWDQNPTQASRPFDKDRNGFVMGEGSAFFVLEPRKQAEQRGATIYAEILAHAATCDAYRLTDPEPTGELAAQCIQLALQRAHLSPSQLDYINAHGTGTPANDTAEINALKKALGPIVYQRPISSCKSMFGHLSMASGAIETAATILSLRQGILPPTLNCLQPAWDNIDFVPQTPRTTTATTFLKNSFGFGGQNACLILNISR